MNGTDLTKLIAKSFGVKVAVAGNAVKAIIAGLTEIIYNNNMFRHKKFGDFRLKVWKGGTRHDFLSGKVVKRRDFYKLYFRFYGKMNNEEN
jgi:nucleoid DNA-binding protein